MVGELCRARHKDRYAEARIMPHSTRSALVSHHDRPRSFGIIPAPRGTRRSSHGPTTATYRSAGESLVRRLKLSMRR